MYNFDALFIKYNTQDVFLKEIYMIDISLLRQKPDFIQQSAKNKNIAIDVQHILEIDTKRSELQKEVQKFQEDRNSFNKSIKGKPTPEQIAEGKELRENIEKKEHALHAVQ